MPVSIFTYGTLQVPEVMQSVTGYRFESEPAILKGYQRYRIKNCSFPGIIKQQGSSVDGIVYRYIDDQSLQLLDLFEDVCYERVEESILVNGEIEKAFVYVVMDKCKDYLSNKEWSLVNFKNKHLKEYLNRI